MHVCGECIKKLSFVTDPYCMKCGRPLGDAGEEFCPDCAKHNKSFVQSRAVLVYDDMTRRAIYRLKYAGKREYAKGFANLTDQRLGDWIRSISPDVIIPVPLHKSRMRKRGFNQTQLIAARLSDLVSIPCRDDIAVRCKKTIPQKNLSRSERQKNLKKAFKIRQNDVRLNTVLVVDDIYTTGSTLDELARCLKEAGAGKVYCLTMSVGVGG